jgi:hypothetical protein
MNQPTSVSRSIDSLLTEASDPLTSPERLRQLSERKRRHERAQLRQTIAANPNADEDLLLALGADYPKEVISNPRFQLLELSGKAWWENCDLRSLCSLALAAGKDTPAFLKTALRLQFEEVYNHYSEYVSVKRRETWCFPRSVEVLADESGGLAPFDIDLDIELSVLMEGRHNPCLEIGDNAADFSHDWISSLLRSLRNECIGSLFDVFGNGPETEPFDIVMEDEVDESIAITSTNSEIETKECSVVMRATGQALFDIRVFYLNDDDAMPSFDFDDNALEVPVSDQAHVDGTDEGTSRDSNDDLGDLEPLWGWEPVVLAPEIPEASWEKWLSAWMMS